MPDKDIHEIMTADSTGQKLVEFANRHGEALHRTGLKRAQIRNIFTEARDIEAGFDRDPDHALRRLGLLRPKLAYQAKRNREVEPLQKTLTEAINEVMAQPDEKRFRRFMELFEAILAYHRFHGGA